MLRKRIYGAGNVDHARAESAFSFGRLQQLSGDTSNWPSSIVSVTNPTAYLVVIKSDIPPILPPGLQNNVSVQSDHLIIRSIKSYCV
jgi:hypothetical protein